MMKIINNSDNDDDGDNKLYFILINDRRCLFV